MVSDTTYQGHQESLSCLRKKKALLICQKSFEYALNIFRAILSSWDLTYLSRNFLRDGVGTLHAIAKQLNAGCQGFIGPFPSAFLDKRCCKNCSKDSIQKSIFPNPVVKKSFFVRFFLSIPSGQSRRIWSNDRSPQDTTITNVRADSVKVVRFTASLYINSSSITFWPSKGQAYTPGPFLFRRSRRTLPCKKIANFCKLF